jgi:hypothetical protein
MLKHDMVFYWLMAMDFPFRQNDTLVSLRGIHVHMILGIIILILEAVVVALYYKLVLLYTCIMLICFSSGVVSFELVSFSLCI